MSKNLTLASKERSKIRSQIRKFGADRFMNRELSWLAFNERVLQEAMNETHPILERLRFLAISRTNLEEFYSVRVAGLEAQERANLDRTSMDGRQVREQLADIYQQSRQLTQQQQETWQILMESIESQGIKILEPDKLSTTQKKSLETYFTEEIFPLLTPLALDPAHPFPFIPNKGVGLALKFKHKRTGKEMEGFIPFPKHIKRFLKLPGIEISYILLEDAIKLFLDKFFPGFEEQGGGVFQVLRDSELEIEEDADDLTRVLETALKRRRRGNAIQLLVSSSIPDDLQQTLIQSLKIRELDVFRVNGLVPLSDAIQLVDEGPASLKFKTYTPRFPERIKDFNGDCFAAIQQKDILVHHPFESFDVVVQFIRQAAKDPNVLAIKQTLYRTSNDSPIVEALIDAAEAGKQVTAVVELKARFDEEANIQWARNMERAGVHVVYGFMELKTHTKLSVIVRRETEGLRSYVHFGTGNYHPTTAKVYTDLSYFTCDDVLAHDAAQVFNFITGYAQPKHIKKLSIAPFDLRARILEYITREIEFAKQGKPAHIWAKMNALLDPVTIDALYEASCMGVQIDLVVRGICALKPGIKDLSENIRIKSIVGRFLEHSRIIAFGNGEILPSPKAKVFISSADWMPRNFDYRVECLIPIENPTVHQQVLEQIMTANMKDTLQSWQMQSNGSYIRQEATEQHFSAHSYFMTNPSLSGRGRALSRDMPSTLIK